MLPLQKPLREKPLRTNEYFPTTAHAGSLLEISLTSGKASQHRLQPLPLNQKGLAVAELEEHVFGHLFFSETLHLQSVVCARKVLVSRLHADLFTEFGVEGEFALQTV
jgi:hypothetical protein